MHNLYKHINLLFSLLLVYGSTGMFCALRAGTPVIYAITCTGEDKVCGVSTIDVNTGDNQTVTLIDQFLRHFPLGITEYSFSEDMLYWVADTTGIIYAFDAQRHTVVQFTSFSTHLLGAIAYDPQQHRVLALEKAEARVMAASAKQPTHIQKIANVSLMDGFEYFVSAFDTHSQDFVFAEYGFYSKENGNAFHTVNTNGSVFQRNFSDYNIFHMKYAQKNRKSGGTNI